MSTNHKHVFSSINPANAEKFADYVCHTRGELEEKLRAAESSFALWKKASVPERQKLLLKLASVLRLRRRVCAEMITKEMGKPIAAAEAEIEKCASLCEYIAEHAEAHLKRSVRESDATLSYLRYDPLGCIFGIVPWNYPFWQGMRFALPSLTAGNVCLIKHAPNVCGSALLFESLFRDAGFPAGVIQIVFANHEAAAEIIRDFRVRGVSLTGSDRAGRAVAEVAGTALKKCVLELGGSDAFIVLADADLEAASAAAALGRTNNAGQICIAPKRFFIEQAVAARFEEMVIEKTREVKVGDPMLADTQMGPLAREDLRETVERQVREVAAAGAKLRLGGEKIPGAGFFFEPTVFSAVPRNSPAFTEEIFGPVISIVAVADADEAVKLTNSSRYGLGAAIWTEDTERAEQLAAQIDTGMVFVNRVPTSDPRLPFGGTKDSGYGRELAIEGMHEFVNVKTVWVR